MAAASVAVAGGRSDAPSNRWAVLALLSVAQLTVVLDATIVNIALPSAQRDLGFSTDSRQSVVTAYALAVGRLLTQALSWRWCLYVTLLIAVPTALAALRLLQNHRPEGRPRIDVPGALTACGGLFALVYGFSNAATHSWTAPVTIIALALSVVLLVSFVAIERVRPEPLLPLPIVLDRGRGGAYIALALVGAGVFAGFLFLTYYLQIDLHFSPVKTGVAFLPLTAVLGVTSTFAQTRVLGPAGVKPLIARRVARVVIPLLLLTRLSPGDQRL